MSFVMALIGHC